jgi:hypothetical protein
VPPDVHSLAWHDASETDREVRDVLYELGSEVMAASPNQKERRSVHRTQWAAQFATASELCKRGYEVAFTMGNATPLADLMVISPTSKKNILIDVKGLYKPLGSQGKDDKRWPLLCLGVRSR